MSAYRLTQYFALFFTCFAAMLVGITLHQIMQPVINNRPVIEALDKKFAVLSPGKKVKPGESVMYRIHYFKRLDVPGELIKQLVIEPTDGNKTIYIPLDFTAGNLPVGKTDAHAFAPIPDWAPAGKARIKISAVYHLGYPLKPVTVYTEDFEIAP